MAALTATASLPALEEERDESEPLVSPSLVSFRLVRLIPGFDDCVTITLLVDVAVPTAFDDYRRCQARLLPELENGLRVRLLFHGVSASQRESVEASFGRLFPGVLWIATFTAKIPHNGTYWLSVELRGEHIPGSPFSIDITPWEPEPSPSPPSPDEIIAPPPDFGGFIPPPPPRKYGCKFSPLLTPEDFADTPLHSLSNGVDGEDGGVVSLGRGRGISINGCSSNGAVDPGPKRKGFGRGSLLVHGDERQGAHSNRADTLPRQEFSPARNTTVGNFGAPPKEFERDRGSGDPEARPEEKDAAGRYGSWTSVVTADDKQKDKNETESVTREPPSFVTPPGPTIEPLHRRPSTPVRPDNSLLLPKAMVEETTINDVHKIRLTDVNQNGTRAGGDQGEAVARGSILGDGGRPLRDENDRAATARAGIASDSVIKKEEGESSSAARLTDFKAKPKDMTDFKAKPKDMTDFKAKPKDITNVPFTNRGGGGEAADLRPKVNVVDYHADKPGFSKENKTAAHSSLVKENELPSKDSKPVAVQSETPTISFLRRSIRNAAFLDPRAAEFKPSKERAPPIAKASTASGVKSASSTPLNLAELFRGGKCEIRATRRMVFAHSATLDYPQGVAVDDGEGGTGNVYVCAMPNHRVVVFDAAGKFLKSFGETGVKHSSPSWQPGQFWRPSGVVCCEGGVFVKDMHRIQEFDKQGVYRRSFGADELREPYGLVANKYGHLLTIDIDDKRKPHLCIFDGSGSLMHERPLKALTDPELVSKLGVNAKNSKCRFLGVYSESVFVVDLSLNCVFVCDFDGGHVAHFGSRGRLVGEFEDAAGITFDTFGNFIVADSKNSRLQVFDAQRDLLGVVKCSDMPSRPSAIYIGKDGALYVCSIWGKCVKKYVFD